MTMSAAKTNLFPAFLGAFLCLLSLGGSAQDLYDAEHTQRYANYLFKARDFQLAIPEYERLCFLDSSNMQARLRLVQAYRLSGNAPLAQARLQSFFPRTPPTPFDGELVRLMLLNRQFDQSQELLKRMNHTDMTELLCLRLTGQLLNHQWDAAHSLLAAPETVGLLGPDNRAQFAPVLTEYQRIIADAQNRKHRSQALSVALSVPVPGLGKVYSGAWKDGIASLAFVGVTAWQAYRGFNRSGKESVYGWVFHCG